MQFLTYIYNSALPLTDYQKHCIFFCTTTAFKIYHSNIQKTLSIRDLPNGPVTHRPEVLFRKSLSTFSGLSVSFTHAEMQARVSEVKELENKDLVLLSRVPSRSISRINNSNIRHYFFCNARCVTSWGRGHCLLRNRTRITPVFVFEQK